MNMYLSHLALNSITTMAAKTGFTQVSSAAVVEFKAKWSICVRARYFQVNVKSTQKL